MKKRILYLAPSPGITLEQSGGAGTHMRGTIQGFEANGFEVLAIVGGNVLGTVVESSSVGVPEKDNRENSIRELVKKIIPLKIRLLLRDIRTIWQDYKLKKMTFRKIEAFQPGLIYERASYLSTYGMKIAQKLNIPYFFETDGCMVEIISKDYGVFSEAVGNKFERAKMHRADYVVVMNELAVNIVARKFHLPESKFVVKTLGVNSLDFPWNMLSIMRLRKQYKVEEKFVVGFVGAISIYHGINYLVEAAIHIAKRAEDIVIMIVGWSKEAETLKKKCDDARLTNIIFTGKVNKSEVANYYKLFDVGVIPDCEESIYPIKVLEYGLLDLCPLVPKYDVFKEIIRQGQTGYYFTPKNAESLGNAILELSNKKEDVKRCASEWKNFVISNFEWKNAVKEVIKVFNANSSLTRAN